MTNLNKQIIFWLISVFLAILSVFLLVGINQKLNTATTTNTVSFGGEGKVLAKPDIVVASLTILTEATTSKIAQDNNSKKSKSVVDFLRKQGIDDKDIKTGGYNIYPQYNYPRPCPLNSSGEFYPCIEKQQISGYQVNQSLEIKIRDLDKVSAILDGVVSAGVNQVNGLNFQVDSPDKLKAQAREMAINDAKKKANELKSQLGIRLGHIVNFSESSNGYPGPIMYETRVKGGMGGDGGPDVPSGENEITVNVTITYQIK